MNEAERQQAKRGYDAAKASISAANNKLEAAKKLLDQALSDIEPNNFTAGWKLACSETIKEFEPKTAIIFYTNEELLYFVVDGDQSYLHDCYIDAVNSEQNLQDELNVLLFDDHGEYVHQKRTTAEVAEAVRNGAKLIECGLL